jgi:RNA polymerase sigma-70 factor, ECF subfamily
MRPGKSVSLAFIAAPQNLPPRQRAALVLRDVLGFRAAETAAILGCTPDAANNLLKRARATITVLTLTGDRISAITGSNDNSVLMRFGLPRILPE